MAHRWKVTWAMAIAFILCNLDKVVPGPAAARRLQLLSLAFGEWENHTLPFPGLQHCLYGIAVVLHWQMCGSHAPKLRATQLVSIHSVLLSGWGMAGQHVGGHHPHG